MKKTVSNIDVNLSGGIIQIDILNQLREIKKVLKKRIKTLPLPAIPTENKYFCSFYFLAANL